MDSYYNQVYYALMIFNVASFTYCITDVTQRYLVAKSYSRININTICYMVFIISIIFTFNLTSLLVTVSPLLLVILSTIVTIDTAKIISNHSSTDEVLKI